MNRLSAVTKGEYGWDTDFKEPYYWVAHPRRADSNYYVRTDKDDIATTLVRRRGDIYVLGGVEDKDASYSYDDWALCKLDSDYYLLSTSGCSCPSPTETWRVEIGPATLSEIRKHVTSGAYEGYTLPKKQEDDFLELIDKAIEEKL